MNVTLPGGSRHGFVRIPASKSQAHRLLILAALGETEVTLLCDGISADIAATMACLNALGAVITEKAEGELHIVPIRTVPQEPVTIPCGESGSTLRFLMPVVGALGANAVFRREGRLPQRPLAPLDRELIAHGMTLREEGDLLYCSGKLQCGDYTLPGDVSSQYISGLLMALPYVAGESRLTISGKRESAAYITMTEDALRLAGAKVEQTESGWRISGSQSYGLPCRCTVESDWSSAAFFLSIGALSREGVTVAGLKLDSAQGDRAVLDVLRRFGAVVEEREDGILVRRGELKGTSIDAAEIPDLIPALAAVAAVAEGETLVYNAARLRLKESDRIRTTCDFIHALGGTVEEQDAGLRIVGVGQLRGGVVDPSGDHRIAMAAAVAACASAGDVTISQSECTAKSYPRFFDDLQSLKGENT